MKKKSHIFFLCWVVCLGIAVVIINKSTKSAEPIIERVPINYSRSQHLPNKDSLPSQTLFDSLRESVLKLEVKQFSLRKPSMRNSGSACVISNDGFLLTNFHVIKGANEIRARSDKGLSYHARLIQTYEEFDLALLKIEDIHATPIMLASSSPAPGSDVWAMGYPIDLPLSISKGSIGGLNRDYDIIPHENAIKHFTQVNTLIQRGFSGGPLLDRHGHLVGIMTAIINEGRAYTGIGMAIPIESINQALRPSTRPNSFHIDDFQSPSKRLVF